MDVTAAYSTEIFAEEVNSPLLPPKSTPIHVYLCMTVKNARHAHRIRTVLP